MRGGRGVLDLPKYSAREGPRTGMVGGGAGGPPLADLEDEGSVYIFTLSFFFIVTLVGNTVNNDNYNYYVCFFVISITAGLLWPCFTMNSYRLSHLKNKLKKNIKMLGR